MVSTARAGRQVAVWSSSRMLTDVVRAGGVHKAGGSVLHLNVHGQVAGVHIVGGILGQREIQHRVGVAVGQGSG